MQGSVYGDMEHLQRETVMNLVVIRSADLERSLRFYKALGIVLLRERHGSGPEHLAATIGTVVLEISAFRSHH
jgi:catechol 2,3-dioxygenase-like lactoylglutathione lyase family enzyme